MNKPLKKFIKDRNKKMGLAPSDKVGKKPTKISPYKFPIKRGTGQGSVGGGKYPKVVKSSAKKNTV